MVVFAALAVALICFSPGAGARSIAATVSLVDTKNHSALQDPAQAPASVVSAKVTYTGAWYSTAWTIADSSGTVVSSGCADTKDHASGPNPNTEYFDLTLPEPAATFKVTVTTSTKANCADRAGSGDTQVTVQAATDNPDLSLLADCGLRVVLVLDESGSIGNTTGATAAVREGAKAFVQGLDDTATQVAVIEFNTQSRTIQLQGKTYNTVDDAYISAFAKYVNGGPSPSYDPKAYTGSDQWTNWQDALTDSKALNPAPNMVVFLTDGDPTAYGTGSATPVTGLTDGSTLAMNPAFDAANALRASKTHMFVIGVGAALSDPASRARLRAISGPNEWKPGQSLIGTDWTVVDTFNELQDQLAALGRNLCAVHVNIVKKVDVTGSGDYLPADSWTFSGTVSAGPTGKDYRWLLPGVDEGPPVSSQTRAAATVNGGKLLFAWRPIPIGNPSQIVLAETQQTGYHFVDASCAANTGGSGLRVTAAGSTLTLTGLQMNDDVTCTYRNAKDTGTITVAKEFVGTPTTVSLWVDNAKKATSDDQHFDTGPVTVLASSGHVARETFVTDSDAALYDTSWSCTNGKDGTGLVTSTFALAKDVKVTCTFTNRRRPPPTVAVAKTPDPQLVLEPGGQVKFTVDVTNRSNGPVTLTSLVDSVFGDLAGDTTADHSWTSSDCAVGQELAPEETYSCSFVGDVAGAPGSSQTDTVTARVEDPTTGESATDKNDATVRIIDQKPLIDVTKSVDPTLIQDSGQASYTAVVTNRSVVDALRIDRLIDSLYGDLIGGPVKASCTFGGDPITLPFTIPAGESIVCSFAVTVSATQTDTLTASGTDDEGNRVDATAAAIVTVEITPPSPPTPPPTPPTPPEPPPTPTPPEPSAPIPLTLRKLTKPQVFRSTDGNATLAYDLRVRNNGPVPATNTTLRDPAPPGSKFTRITKQPSQGSCTIAQEGALLSCNLGTLVEAQQVDVAVQLRASARTPDTVTNTATASCKTSPAAECEVSKSATTQLRAPFKPPAPACSTLSVAPASLTANGAAQTLTVRVTRGRTPVQGATVTATGPGIARIARTNSAGIARMTLKPSTPGVATIGLRGQTACAAKQVGLARASTPPLTG